MPALDDQQTREYYENNPAAQWLALLVVCAGTILTPIALASVYVAIPTIASDLHAHALLVSWVPTAFLLANVVGMLPAGHLADKYGRKRIYLCGHALFAVASIGACAAPSIELLLVWRVLQGLGAAMLFSCAQAIVMGVFMTGRRGTALGVMTSSIYFGVTLGPFLGGWLTEHYGWRSVFLFPAPFSILVILFIIYKLKGEWLNEQAKPIDWLGSLYIGIWASSLFLGVSLIPQLSALALLLGGMLFLVLFIRRQERIDYPLIRLKAMWGNKLFSRSALAAMLMYGGIYQLVFLLSLYLQFIKGMSPSAAGRLMVLQALMMAFVAPIAGRFSDRRKTNKITSVGCLIVAAGFVPLCFLDEQTSIYWIATAMLTIGLGFGLFSTPNNNAALSAVPESRLGIASAVMNLSRVLGNMVGTAAVLFLVSSLIGAAQIQPEQYGALLKVIHYAMLLSLLLTLAGAAVSRAHWQVATHNKNLE